MVSILHRDGACGKAVALSKGDDFGCVVVSHQEVSGEMLALRKQSLVIDFGMGVEATACALTTSGVGWINKKDRIGIVAVLSECGKGVALNEG